MAGGVKKPVNIFKLKQLGIPRQTLNWRLWLAVLNFGLLGTARGIDEGLITAAFNSPSFQKLIHFDQFSAVEQANIKGNVTAMVLLGSIPGSLIAAYVCDRVGRLWAMRELCIVWIVGIVIFMVSNGNMGAIYVGRFIAGIGIGQSVVVGPIYVAEIAPAPIRGLCTCFYAGFAYSALVVAYFANYGASLHQYGKPAQWYIPTTIHFMYATLVLLLSLFQTESPRFLMKRGKKDRAIAAMSRIRNLPPTDPYVAQEIADIEQHWHEEQETIRGQGFLGLIKEIFLVPSNLFRLYLGVGSQLLAQWSGAGSITIYAVDFFALVGITGRNESLLATAVFGVVKFLAAMSCMLFLVDFIGRKRSLLLGITLQAISMLYVASFLSSEPRLGVDDSYTLPASKKGASEGAIAMIFLSGFGWALGWNSMQYVLTAELFPLRIRAACASIVMCVHFANQYGNARAVPNMLLPKPDGGIAPTGTFWTFAAITIAGGIWVLVSLPETAGRSLESMDRLFQLPWYKIGLFGNRDAEERDNQEIVNEKNANSATHVEIYQGETDKTESSDAQRMRIGTG